MLFVGGKEDIWFLVCGYGVARDVFHSSAREVYAEDELLPFLHSLLGDDFKGGVRRPFQTLLISGSGLLSTFTNLRGSCPKNDIG